MKVEEEEEEEEEEEDEDEDDDDDDSWRMTSSVLFSEWWIVGG